VFLLHENKVVEDYHHASLHGCYELVDWPAVRRTRERNNGNIAQDQAGISITTLSKKYAISVQRVH
jgi:hypothetical protein